MFDPKEYSLSIKGKGDPLFLVHGIGNTKNAWDYLLPALNKKFTTITYDLCGHGNSPIKKGHFSGLSLSNKTFTRKALSPFRMVSLVEA